MNSTSTFTAKTTANKLTIGMRALCLFDDDGGFYPGYIHELSSSSSSGEATFTFNFDDGDVRECKFGDLQVIPYSPPSQAQSPPQQDQEQIQVVVGMTGHCQFPEEDNEYYHGVVSKLNEDGTTFVFAFDDGDIIFDATFEMCRDLVTNVNVNVNHHAGGADVDKDGGDESGGGGEYDDDFEGQGSDGSSLPSSASSLSSASASSDDGDNDSSSSTDSSDDDKDDEPFDKYMLPSPTFKRIPQTPNGTTIPTKFDPATTTSLSANTNTPSTPSTPNILSSSLKTSKYSNNSSTSTTPKSILSPSIKLKSSLTSTSKSIFSPTSTSNGNGNNDSNMDSSIDRGRKTFQFNDTLNEVKIIHNEPGDNVSVSVKVRVGVGASSKSRQELNGQGIGQGQGQGGMKHPLLQPSSASKDAIVNRYNDLSVGYYCALREYLIGQEEVFTFTQSHSYSYSLPSYSSSSANVNVSKSDDIGSDANCGLYGVYSTLSNKSNKSTSNQIETEMNTNTNTNNNTKKNKQQSLLSTMTTIKLRMLSLHPLLPSTNTSTSSNTSSSISNGRLSDRVNLIECYAYNGLWEQVLHAVEECLSFVGDATDADSDDDDSDSDDVDSHQSNANMLISLFDLIRSSSLSTNDEITQADMADIITSLQSLSSVSSSVPSSVPSQSEKLIKELKTLYLNPKTIHKTYTFIALISSLRHNCVTYSAIVDSVSESTGCGESERSIVRVVFGVCEPSHSNANAANANGDNSDVLSAVRVNVLLNELKSNAYSYTTVLEGETDDTQFSVLKALTLKSSTIANASTDKTDNKTECESSYVTHEELFALLARSSANANTRLRLMKVKIKCLTLKGQALTSLKQFTLANEVFADCQVVVDSVAASATTSFSANNDDNDTDESGVGCLWMCEYYRAFALCCIGEVEDQIKKRRSRSFNNHSYHSNNDDLELLQYQLKQPTSLLTSVHKTTSTILGTSSKHTARASLDLASAYTLASDFEQAQVHLEQALVVYSELGQGSGKAYVDVELGRVKMRTSNISNRRNSSRSSRSDDRDCCEDNLNLIKSSADFYSTSPDTNDRIAAWKLYKELVVLYSTDYDVIDCSVQASSLSSSIFGMNSIQAYKAVKILAEKYADDDVLEYDKSREMYERCIDVACELFGERDYRVVKLRKRLGVVEGLIRGEEERLEFDDDDAVMLRGAMEKKDGGKKEEEAVLEFANGGRYAKSLIEKKEKKKKILKLKKRKSKKALEPAIEPISTAVPDVKAELQGWNVKAESEEVVDFVDPVNPVVDIVVVVKEVLEVKAEPEKRKVKKKKMKRKLIKKKKIVKVADELAVPD